MRKEISVFLTLTTLAIKINKEQYNYLLHKMLEAGHKMPTSLIRTLYILLLCRIEGNYGCSYLRFKERFHPEPTSAMQKSNAVSRTTTYIDNCKSAK